MCLNETYSKVLIGRHLSDNFLNQNGLKQRDALLPVFFNFALEFAIRKVHKNQVGLKLNRTHQLLVYADDVNLMEDNIDTTKKNTETVIDASKEVGLEVNTEKTMYTSKLTSNHQNEEQNHDTKTANRSFGNVAKFKYLRTVTNQNLIHDKIKSRLNSGNACCHSAQNSLPSCLP
jgi:hypothetical protein